MSDFVSYKDHFLVAAPNMKDPVFSKTVIYLCSHTPEGAMGIVINRGMALSVASLLERVGIDSQNDELHEMMLFDGGPVQVERGFVLHTPKNKYHSSVSITEQITLSTSRDVLEAIANVDQAPDKFLISLGYSGWSEGQLESELALSGWLIAPADSAVIFDVPVERRYDVVLESIGLSADDFSHWSQGTGHA